MLYKLYYCLKLIKVIKKLIKSRIKQLIVFLRDHSIGVYVLFWEKPNGVIIRYTILLSSSVINGCSKTGVLSVLIGNTIFTVHFIVVCFCVKHEYHNGVCNFTCDRIKFVCISGVCVDDTRNVFWKLSDSVVEHHWNTRTTMSGKYEKN